jgi:hypothetical protein
VVAAVLAKLLQNRDAFITVPVPDQRATQSSRSGWALFKSNTRKQTIAGFTAAADVQSASIQRGNWSWIRVGNKLQKPAPMVETNLEKKKGGLRNVMKVKNAFAKGVKALV